MRCCARSRQRHAAELGGRGGGSMATSSRSPSSPDGNWRPSTRPEALLHSVTRPFDVDSKMLQAGAFLGVAEAPAADITSPTCCAARPSRWIAPVGRAAQPSGSTPHGTRAHRPWRTRARHAHRSRAANGSSCFRPQVDLKPAVIGSVLARWRHRFRLIMPDTFIPAAKRWAHWSVIGNDCALCS
jgi:hypothetical protein